MRQRQRSAGPDEEILQTASGLSFADIRSAEDDARKESTLAGRDAPLPGEVRDMLLAWSQCRLPHPGITAPILITRDRPGEKASLGYRAERAARRGRAPGRRPRR